MKFIIIILLFIAQSAHAGIMAGWFTSLERPEYLDIHARESNNLVLVDGVGWYSTWRPNGWNAIRAYLNKAHGLGLKVILTMTKEHQTPYGIPVKDFVDTINEFKSHPAVFGWYLADEPELHPVNNWRKEPDGWKIAYDYLKTNPGYYNLLKAADPNHPVFITHDQSNQRYHLAKTFFDVTDISGFHAYPFWKGHAEFQNIDSRKIYDQWKQQYIEARTAGKDFIATAQGFGDGSDSPNRNPTYNELKYEVFSAIGIGIDKILFWHYYYSNNALRALVAKVANEIMAVSGEMYNGRTNDPAIKVSQKLVADEKLLIRYGKRGNNHAILAVNIANRDAPTGLALNNVQFTLPPGISTSKVEVVGEGRTIPVQGATFEDSFDRFQVHIYRFKGESGMEAPADLRILPKQG